MAYIHEILGKANIRSVADFLLFGLGPMKIQGIMRRE